MSKSSVRARFLVETRTACHLAVGVSAITAVAWTVLAGPLRGSLLLEVPVLLAASASGAFIGLHRLRKAQEAVLEPGFRSLGAIQRFLARGNFSERVERPTADEFAPLAEQINIVFSRIEQNDGALEKLKAERDQQIEELNRTFQAKLDAQREGFKEVVLAKAAAEESSLAKSAFLFNMSHELRTPLNAIMGYSELLQEEAGDRGTQASKDVAKILGAGKHLLTLINAVLDLSKIEAGRLEVQAETFDVSQLLTDVLSTAESLAAAQRNMLTVRITPGLGTMHTDPTKFRQVLLNLLGNACKFTTEGTITLEAERERNLADWIVIRVKDTGIGMSAEDLTGLFREFKQARSERQRSTRGSGLGLAISQALCQLMGGVIQVESTVGVGSTFTARLPAQYPSVTGLGASLAARTAALSSKADADPSRPACTRHRSRCGCPRARASRDVASGIPDDRGHERVRRLSTGRRART